MPKWLIPLRGNLRRHKANTGKLGNPKSSFQRDPPSYQNLGVKNGWTDVIATSPIIKQSLDYGHGTVTVASSGGVVHSSTQPQPSPTTQRPCSVLSV